MIRTIEYQGFPNCLELSNDHARLIISTDFGPRILFYGLDVHDNVLGWHPDAAVETQLGTWKPYGGHRLWAAPENMPLSYEPDNEPVDYGSDGDYSVNVASKGASGIFKEMDISLDVDGSGVLIGHRLSNRSEKPRQLSAWALTIMRPGGTAVIPNEEFRPYSSESLLPVRSMAVWSYTDFTDPRWKVSKDEIRLSCDAAYGDPQKVGVLNTQGKLSYEVDGMVFTKTYDFIRDAQYPDLNCNTEVYTAGSFIELETLSPLHSLESGGMIQHSERWELSRAL